MTVEYQVQHLTAEVGFYTDVLAFSINALDSAYAMFSSPNEEFHNSPWLAHHYLIDGGE